MTPSRLWNRGLIAAIVINAGGYFAGGTYEVIWSLFLEGLGADLALIGLTFAMFGLPVLVLSPIAGKIVDRRGSVRVHRRWARCCRSPWASRTRGSPTR